MTEDISRKLALAAAEKPKLRLRSRYDPIHALWRHPAYLGAGVFTPVFLLPEVKWIMEVFTGIDGVFGTFLSLFGCFLVTFGWPLFSELMESLVFRCVFYSDHLELTYNWMFREKTSVPYRGISTVKITANWVQRKAGMGDLDFMLSPNAGRLVLAEQKVFSIQDVKNPVKALERVKKILAAYRGAGVSGV